MTSYQVPAFDSGDHVSAVSPELRERWLNELADALEASDLDTIDAAVTWLRRATEDGM